MFLVKKITYANNDYISYTYDELDRLSKKVYSDSNTYYTYHYDSFGNLGLIIEHGSNDSELSRYMWEYSADGKLLSAKYCVGSGLSRQYKYHTTYSYDAYDRPSGYTQSVRSMGTYTTRYVYGNAADGEREDTVYSIAKGVGGSTPTEIVSYVYDDFGRLSQKSVHAAATRGTYYTYRDISSSQTTTQVASVRNNYANGSYGDDRYYYEYDNRGFISHIKIVYGNYYTYHIYYSYDALGQLTREDNQLLNKSVTYTYDQGGNITHKKTYAYTTGSLSTATEDIAYSYELSNNRDLLTKYNGTSISYDNSFNPLIWYDGKSLMWEQGRRLKQITQNGNTYTYTYDDAGLRTSKTVGGVTTEYYWLGSTLVGAKSPSGWMYFYYDENGRAYGFRAGYSSGSADYYYQYDAQGNVVGLLNNSGGMVCRYVYDSWGKLLKVCDASGNVITDSTSIAHINPLRYRGYYYDPETGFYYLQSRYYDPNIGRFINADDIGNLGTGNLISYNLFAYCCNNPVMGFDPTGCWNWGGVIIGFGIVAATVITVATLGVGSEIGVIVAVAAITTGITMMYAAATDSAMVIDLTGSFMDVVELGRYERGGCSLVIDFSDNVGIYLYSHVGVGRGYSNGISYSVGLVSNFNMPDDYSGHFIGAFADKTIGIEHCFDPARNYNNTTTATTASFSLGVGLDVGFGVGYDNYSAPIIVKRNTTWITETEAIIAGFTPFN